MAVVQITAANSFPYVKRTIGLALKTRSIPRQIIYLFIAGMCLFIVVTVLSGY